jgi:hypothetical protein
MSEISSAKAHRLDAVFKKAIDVAANSLNETDLEESFGELRNQFGGSMNKLFMNLIGRMQSNIEVQLFHVHAIYRFFVMLQILQRRPHTKTFALGEKSTRSYSCWRMSIYATMKRIRHQPKGRIAHISYDRRHTSVMI